MPLPSMVATGRMPECAGFIGQDMLLGGAELVPAAALQLAAHAVFRDFIDPLATGALDLANGVLHRRRAKGDENRAANGKAGRPIMANGLRKHNGRVSRRL